jgi:tetratricopeptide (TPR) repeat protein
VDSKAHAAKGEAADNNEEAVRNKRLNIGPPPTRRGTSIESKNQYSGAPGPGRLAALHAQMPHPLFHTHLRWPPRDVAWLLQTRPTRWLDVWLSVGLAVWLATAASAARADEMADARAFIARGQLDAALQSASRAVASNPRNAQARFLLGVVLMDMARDAQAVVAFTELTQEYPELPDPYNNLALLHARQGRLELARQALETALRNDPNHRAAQANLGQIHLMLAVKAWEQAAALGPIDLPLQRRLESARALLVSPALASPATAVAPVAR